MPFDLAGQVALVTGSASGIGAAVVDAFRAAGAEVASLDVNPRPERAGVLDLTVDVTDSIQVQDAVTTARDSLGRIDALVHCAGITRDAVHWKLDLENWNEVLDVNLTGSFLLLKSVIPVMRAQQGGSVVLLSSINGMRGKFGQANYSASKAGVIALARTAALEAGAFGIRVNAVAPGLVHTPMTEQLPAEVRQQALDRIPLGRAAEPDDVAGPILFLCSPLARHITGTVLRVDGGQWTS